MIRDAIGAVVEGRHLDTMQAKEVMSELISGSATPSQIGAFLTASRMKGETEDELVGYALAMRESCARLSAPRNAVDLCGTGGDGAGTFNISTAASFIVSSCGVPVAKHGNRSVSSASGSADLLEALGIPYDLDPASVQASIDSTGFGFMFAPVFHSSMRNVVAPRREVGIRTLFNVLGPLTNPARVSNQLMGVYDPSIAPKVARVLSRLGVDRAMVVNGCGTDEMSNLGPTRVSELRDGAVREYTISPSDLGLDVVGPEELAAGSPMASARAVMSVLRGEKGPRYDAVALNAAAALYVSGAAQDLDVGLSLARQSVETGRAMRKMREIAEFARGKESERQRVMDVPSLRSRRIVPDALRARASEITHDLERDILSLRDGRGRLDSLDPVLLSSPNVLSVIALSRLEDVMSKGVPDIDASRDGARPFYESISGRGLSVVGEYKPRSPSSMGAYVPPEPAAVAAAYERAGVSAMSVLVEDRFFGGSAELFSLIRESTSLPMLFKDFVVSEEQLDLAKRVGADAVLLIAKVLTKDALDRFMSLSVRNGVEPLVELHDAEDAEKLSSCDNAGLARMVGLNSRDLRTLRTDIPGLTALRARIPSDKLVVAESGVRSGSDLRSLRGFHAILVGTALMESADVAKKAEELVSAGRGVSS